MREANPERQYEHQLKQIPSQKHLTKEAVLSEIQHLKKVILNIEQRQLSKTKKINTVQQKQQKVNQYDQLKMKTNSSPNDSRLQFGSKFFKDVNQTFRARMVNRKHRANDQSNDHSTFNKYWQEGQEQKSIIQMADQLNKADSSNFVSERPDSEEEDCPGTQLYAPAAKPKSRHIMPNNGGSNKDFHFRKVDYILALEEDKNKFYSYIKDHKQKAFNIKNRFGREQQKSNTFRMMNVSSQPQIGKKTVKNKVSIHRSQPSFEEQLFKNTIHKDSPKQQFISFGQTIFSQYLPNFNSTDKFTIKKYKNCAVFSLLPHITKAAIWYYSKQLFIGNISLNESGNSSEMGLDWKQSKTGTSTMDIFQIVRKAEGEKLCTKMEISMMVNGTRERSMALEDSRKGRLVKFLKDFGKTDNSVVPSTMSSTRNSSNFHEQITSILSRMIQLLLLLLLILFFLLFILPDYISVLINVISSYHLAEFLILIISALSFLIGITHIVYKYIVNFLQHIFALFSKIDLNAKTVSSQTYIPSSFGCTYYFDNIWNLFIILLNLCSPTKTIKEFPLIPTLVVFLKAAYTVNHSSFSFS